MDSDVKIFIVMFTIIVILSAAIAIVAATYPQAPPKDVIVYRNWWIYTPNENATRSSYVATHAGYTPITDSDLQLVIAAINEVTK